MADFTTAMTGSAVLDDSIVTLMETQFLIAAADMGIMDQLVTFRQEIGAKSIEMPKYGQLALATTALTEKEDVTSTAMADTKISFTPAEHGAVVTTTKLINLQSGGKADVAAARLIGMNAQRSLDKLAILAADASSNSLTVDGGLESALTDADVMTTTFLNKMYNKLARQSVMPLAGGFYVAVLHDDQIHDLRNSTGAGSWQDITKYSNPSEVLRNEIGNLAGFRIIRDNNITINADAGDASVDTYNGLFMGFNALGKAESHPLMQTITGPFDKLGRFVNYGWYACVKYGILDQDAIYVGVTASSVGANA